VVHRVAVQMLSNRCSENIIVCNCKLSSMDIYWRVTVGGGWNDGFLYRATFNIECSGWLSSFPDVIDCHDHVLLVEEAHHRQSLLRAATSHASPFGAIASLRIGRAPSFMIAGVTDERGNLLSNLRFVKTDSQIRTDQRFPPFSFSVPSYRLCIT
jgi:hypothetical protein